MKSIIKTAVLATALLANVVQAASWRVVEEKNFKGEIEAPMYLLEQGKNTLAVVKSEGGSWKVVFDNPEVKNAMKGIKVDGEYLDCQGGTFGDGYIWVEGCLSFDSATYAKILKAKKVEVNVDYFRKGQRVTTFHVTKPVTFREE